MILIDLAILLLGALSLPVSLAQNASNSGNPLGIGFAVPMNSADIPSGCSDFEILYARGTSELGKLGIIVGDTIIPAVVQKVPGARGYPVQYPASFDFPGGRAVGVPDIVGRLKNQSAACPQQNFALMGYSQGADLMHSAAALIPNQTFSRIKAVVMFGDPYIQNKSGISNFPPPLQPVVLNNCANGDPICDQGPCFFNHLSYMTTPWTDRAVNFLVNAFMGTPVKADDTKGIQGVELPSNYCDMNNPNAPNSTLLKGF